MEYKELLKYEEVLSAVESGDNKAKTNLAWYKLSGYGGVEIDEDYAVALLEERVKDKEAEAMWMLGLCYEYGMGCEQDLEKAELLYKQSNDSGSMIGKFLFVNGKDKRGTGIMIARGNSQSLLKRNKKEGKDIKYQMNRGYE